MKSFFKNHLCGRSRTANTQVERPSQRNADMAGGANGQNLRGFTCGRHQLIDLGHKVGGEAQDSGSKTGQDGSGD
jgi:hypothetical protein